MKVILQKTVPNLGDAGEIKEVAPGYAVNYLIPRKMVIPATASSRKQLAHQQRLIKLKTDRRMGELKTIHDSIQNLEITVPVKVGLKNKLFGSVTANDIAKALQEKGFDIEKRKVDLIQPIREIGKQTVNIRLAPGLVSEISVIVEADQASQEEIEKLEREEQERAERRKAAKEAEEAAEEAARAAQEGRPVQVKAKADDADSEEGAAEEQAEAVVEATAEEAAEAGGESEES